MVTGTDYDHNLREDLFILFMEEALDRCDLQAQCYLMFYSDWVEILRSSEVYTHNIVINVPQMRYFGWLKQRFCQNYILEMRRTRSINGGKRLIFDGRKIGKFV